MLRRFIIAIATVAALGISFGSTDVSAQWGGGGGHGGGFHGGGFRGGGYRGGGWHGGGGWGLGAGLLGGAILGGMLASPSPLLLPRARLRAGGRSCLLHAAVQVL